MTELTLRGYQQEMLDESLKRNIVIALDTGSGKTRIAILRMKTEAEREFIKISWFLAPTVVLCEQQHRVISEALPVSVGLISGALEPEQWKDHTLWRKVVSTHRIVVSTPQVLLDALRHGYVSLGNDIGLLVFDEAHHAADKHPYNLIMSEFYHILPLRGSVAGLRSPSSQRPSILGLTASPVFGGQVDEALRIIERNLDSTISAPLVYRDELALHVNKPIFTHILYASPNYDNPPFCHNLHSLELVLGSLDIEDDPHIKALRRRLASFPQNSPQWSTVDQKLSKAIKQKNTFTHKGLTDFYRAAVAIRDDIGPWAADWYVEAVLAQAKALESPYGFGLSALLTEEKLYLLKKLSQMQTISVSYLAGDLSSGLSDKSLALIDCLQAEKTKTEANNEVFNALIFVNRRDAVIALAHVLRHHPDTAPLFQVGCLVGTSDGSRRYSFLDIASRMLREPYGDVLREFRHGEKTLLVSTAVAEEGLDIPSCGSVIRWDPPANMVSWAQSKGRARRKRSSVILMFDGLHMRSKFEDWQRLEKDMMSRYNDSTRTYYQAVEQVDAPSEGDDKQFCIAETGAVLTLDSAIAHLAHFCAIMDKSIEHQPVYSFDPPDFPEGWHSFDNRLFMNPTPYQGPWSCKVTLPCTLRRDLRVFVTPRKHDSKRSAQRHAAFDAYLALHRAGLLNSYLMPIFSDMKIESEEEIKAVLRGIAKRTGMADVMMQMNPWIPQKDDAPWQVTEITIGGLPALHMFTRTSPNLFIGAESPILYYPHREPIIVGVCPLGTSQAASDRLADAREYTRRLFWIMHGGRMKWDKLDFACLFLPKEGPVDSHWDARCQAFQELCDESEKPRPDAHLFANARAFGRLFSWPDDLVSVNVGGPGTLYRFVRWRTDALSMEEQAKLRRAPRKALSADLEIQYPVLEVQPQPGRKSFLDPPQSTSASAPVNPKTSWLLPQFSNVVIMSETGITYATFLPSILHSLSVSATIASLRDTLFADSPLSSLPLDLLTTAVTAPMCQARTNYQRLETLGDAILKFITSIQLLAEHPLWHEGYLTKAHGHAVSNVRLAKVAVANELYRWIIRDKFAAKKWKPPYFEAPAQDAGSTPGKGKKKGRQDKTRLSTKILADVVESLVGAAYLHGSFDLAIDCIEIFDIGIRWQKLSPRVETILKRTPLNAEYPFHIANVERMLDYKFNRKLLLVEALTHSSHQGDYGTLSYERLEFLGDSTLDAIVTHFLYNAAGKNYSPGHMHMRKAAVVNAHLLAFICLRCFDDVSATIPRVLSHGRIVVEEEQHRVYLWQCLLHSSMRLLDMQNFTLSRFQKIAPEIENALQNGTIYPWAALTKLQAPKFFSDIVESVIGAVYLDSNGDMDVVRRLLRTLGIMPILERIVEQDMDVLHPISRMTNWAAKHKMKVEFQLVEEKGELACTVLVNGEAIARSKNHYWGKTTETEVKFQAAEDAIKKLRIRDAGDMDLST